MDAMRDAMRLDFGLFALSLAWVVLLSSKNQIENLLSQEGMFAGNSNFKFGRVCVNKRCQQVLFKVASLVSRSYDGRLVLYLLASQSLELH